MRVGTLLEDIAYITGPLGHRVRKGLPESNIIAQLGGRLGEIRGAEGVTKEAMAGIVPGSWLDWSHRPEGDLASTAPEADILAAHDVVTTNSRKVQPKLGKLVNYSDRMLPTQPCRNSCRRRHARRDRTTH